MEAPHIFLDQDGVLTNWPKAASVWLEREIGHGEYVNPKEFHKLNSSNFWANIEWQPWAIELIHHVAHLQGTVSIISRLPQVGPSNARQGKMEAIDKLRRTCNVKFHLIMVNHDALKFDPNWAKTGDILIDDFTKEVDAWNLCGGRAFQFHVGFVREYPHCSLNTYKKLLTELHNGTYVPGRY